MDLKNLQSCTNWVQQQNEALHSTWAILVTAVATIAVLYVAVVYQRRKELPPGPYPWPIVGNSPLSFGSQNHKSLQKLTLKYGGLMYPQLGGAYRNLGLAPFGPFWRRFRRVANTQLFSPAVHASHEPIRKREIHSTLRVLVEDSHKGKTINFKSWLTSVTANNMTMMLTNKRIFEIGADNDEKKRDLGDLMRRTFALVGSFIINYVPYLNFITKLQGWVSEMQEVRALGGSIIGNNFQVDEHRERAKEMDLNDTEYVPDHIDVLLKTSLDDGDRLPDRDIVSLVVGLMNAGTDTSANTVE